jgi:hypothetical protein
MGRSLILHLGSLYIHPYFLHQLEQIFLCIICTQHSPINHLIQQEEKQRRVGGIDSYIPIYMFTFQFLHQRWISIMHHIAGSSPDAAGGAKGRWY